jgi:putative membrane protein
MKTIQSFKVAPRLAVILGLANPAMAQEAAQTPAKGLGHALLYLVIFSAVGVITMVAGFKLFDWAIRRINIEAELLKGNVAVGILAGAVIIGISIIVAASMM